MTNSQDIIESIIKDKTKAPIGFYRKKVNRVQLIHYLVEQCLNRQGNDRLTPLSVQDFKDFNLYSFLTSYYSCSPKKALLEAYSDELQTNDIFQNKEIIIQKLINHEIKEPPRGFWLSPENRAFTIKYLLETHLQKNPYEVTSKDFINNRLGGLLSHYYKGSIMKALKETYPELKCFLLSRLPSTYFNDDMARLEAFNHYKQGIDKETIINLKLLKKLKISNQLFKFYQKNPNILHIDILK